MPHQDERLTRLEHFLGRPLRPGSDAHIASTPIGRTQRRAALEEVVPGYAVRVPERGSAYKVITPVSAGGDCDLHGRFAAAWSSPETPLQQHLLQCYGMAVPPEDVLFFDVESTGLGQTPLFLIGAMTWEQDDLIVRQFLARDYREEAAIIQLLVELAAEKRLLITFNGKSFDVPLLYRRAEVHDLRCVLHMHHWDLLHDCRRAWSAQLPNSQLQTLEQQICGYPPREDDIPSETIPRVYEMFVRNGNALPLVPVIRHNRRDLQTMAELLLQLPFALFR